MRTVTALLCLCVSLPISASGLYGGAQLGASYLRGDLSNGSTSYQLNFFSYGAYLGYKVDLSSAFLAVEGDLMLNEVTMKSHHPDYKKHNLLGVSGLVGTSVSHNIDVYARLGQVRSEFKLRDSATSTRYSQYKNGLSMGFGGRYRFDDKVSVRVDYRHNQYDQPRFAGHTTRKDVKEHLLNVGMQYQF